MEAFVWRGAGSKREEGGVSGWMKGERDAKGRRQRWGVPTRAWIEGSALRDPPGATVSRSDGGRVP